MFETLDSDSLREIVLHLDTYQCMNLALTNRFLYNKLYDSEKIKEITSQMKETVRNKETSNSIIQCINDTGVRRAYCDDCHALGLLCKKGGANKTEKWVCIECCLLKCLHCEAILNSKHIGGWYEHIMCHNCHQRFRFRQYSQ